MNSEAIFCCNCNEWVNAKAVPASHVYPKRHDLQGKIYLQCPTCSGTVGAHRDGRPLGCIPTPAVRSMRITIHDRIRGIVGDRRLTTCLVYRYLSGCIGQEYHTGNIKSVEEADKILNLLSDLYFSLYEEAHE